MSSSKTIAAIAAAVLMAACGGQQARVQESPAATAPPGSPTPASSGQGPADISGTWVVQQAATAADVDSPVVETALRTPGIRGYSLRVAWKDIDGNTALLDDGARVAAAHHLAFSIRFMAGRFTPARIFAAGSPYYTVGGERVPAPFTASGGPNTVFEQAYRAELDTLAAWCAANGVHLLHLPWYGQNYAELNNGIEVRSAPGYSYQAWLTGHERLVDIAFAHASPTLAVEFPLSGYGPLQQASPDLARYIAGAIHGQTGEFYVQANGLSPTGSFGSANPSIESGLDKAVWPEAIGHGEQMIQPGDFDWNQVYSVLARNRATYVEIYAQSFNPGLAHHGDLLKAIASFQPA